MHCFRSEAELAEWSRASGNPAGRTVPVQTIYDLSRHWYAGREAFDWQPLTAVESQELFRAHGLTGDFWSLT